MYRHTFMLRLVNHSPKLSKLYLERTNGRTDYAQILEQIFLELVVHDPILLAEYKNLSDMPKHIITETPATKNIQMLINIYGWEEFVKGLILLAKNKEARLTNTGMSKDITKSWEKIAKLLSAMPKRPQF